MFHLKYIHTVSFTGECCSFLKIMLFCGVLFVSEDREDHDIVVNATVFLIRTLGPEKKS